MHEPHNGAPVTGFILSSAGAVGITSLLRTDVGALCRVAEDRDHREAVYKNDGLVPGLSNGVGNDLQ